MTQVTNAAQACDCRCACCTDEPKPKDQEIAELHTLRKSIDRRLAELGAE